MSRKIEKYGKLTVVSDAYKNPKGWLVKCVCDCGKTKEAYLYKLKSGHTKSCGCLRKEALANSTRTHGMSNSAEMRIWTGIKTRCENPACKAYPNYGGRGIRISPEWRSFKDFIRDMGLRPSSKHSIDRIDNNKGYSKNNCRWATRFEQAQNKRTTRKYNFNGKTLSIPEWSLITGVKAATLHKRINIDNWTIEKALTTKTRKDRRYHEKH